MRYGKSSAYLTRQTISSSLNDKKMNHVENEEKTFIGLGWSLLYAVTFNNPGIRLVRTTCRK